MDVSRAIGYPFKGENVIVKLIIGTVISIIPIVNFISAGYMLRVLRDSMANEDAEMPEWDDFGGDFVRGLMVFIASLVYSIPIIILSLTIVPIALIDGDEGALTSIYTLCCFMPLAFLYAFFFVPIFAAACINYVQTGDFGRAFFSFGARFKEVSQNLSDSVMFIIFYLVIQIVVGIIVGFTIWLCGLGFLFTWAGYLMIARLTADYGRAIGAENGKSKRGIVL